VGLQSETPKSPALTEHFPILIVGILQRAKELVVEMGVTYVMT